MNNDIIRRTIKFTSKYRAQTPKLELLYQIRQTKNKAIREAQKLDWQTYTVREYHGPDSSYYTHGAIPTPDFKQYKSYEDVPHPFTYEYSIVLRRI